MHHSISALAVLSLLGLSSAVPTPVGLAPRCGTTLVPTILQQLQESNPTFVGPNTVSGNGDFHVAQGVDGNGNVNNRIYQFAGFQGIPSGSYGCQLAVTFPSNYAITSSGTPTLNVTTVYTGSSASITYPNNLSWSSLSPPTSPPLGQGLFGTVTMTPGTTQVINSEACPGGEGNLAFLFSIAGWVSQPASVEFDEYVNQLNGAGLAGIYLTYDC